MEIPSRYPYNPKWQIIFACATFFGACFAFMAYKASYNTVGLTINGIITLGPTGATVFYWVISSLGAGFVLLAVLLTVRRIANPRVFEIGVDALLLPHGRFQSQTSRISYADIDSVSEVQVSGQTFLYVIAGGMRYTIVASLLPDIATYRMIRDFLVSHASSQST